MVIKLLTGKALANRVASFGKVASTFSESAHIVAASVIAEINLNGATAVKAYLIPLYTSSPINLQRALRVYFGTFCKVTFDKENKDAPFKYSKKTGLSDDYLNIGPMEFMKAKKTGGDKKTKNRAMYLKRIERMVNEADIPADIKSILQGLITKEKVVKPVEAATSPVITSELIKGPANKDKNSRKVKAMAEIAELIA